MRKCFRDAIRLPVADHLVGKDFTPAKLKLDAVYAGSVVHKRMMCKGLWGFLHLQFVKDRNYVIPSVQWSRDGLYPDEAECFQRQEGQPLTPEEMRDRFSAGWLRATAFGLDGDYKIDEIAPLSVLKAAYSTPSAQTVLRSDPFLVNGRWEASVEYTTWDAVIAITGVVPTDPQAELAVSGVIDRVCKIFDEVFIPFLDNAKLCS